MRYVMFDVDGVLIHGYHTRPEKRRCWDEQMETDLGISRAAFRDVFIKGIFERDVLTGCLSLVQALDQTLPAMGANVTSLQLVSYWLNRDSILNVPLLDVVRRLQVAAGVTLCVATNQEHMRAFHLWNVLGFQDYFQDVFYSARLGVLKPDPRFFEAAMRIIGHQERPPLMFDDSPAVIAAANDFGWEAVLFEDVGDCTQHPWIRQMLDQAA